MTHDSTSVPRRFHGPRVWAAAAFVGGLIGGCVGLMMRTPEPPVIQLWMAAPFATLLACIALMPFFANRFWHLHYPDISLFLGAMVAAFYVTALTHTTAEHPTPYGVEKMLHAAEEFYAFIALVGGLYIVSGGIMVDVQTRATPLANTILLAIGAIIANFVGTTGASMLLIRPFMRLNQGRLSPLHIVFFIFIVSNCGGCLTPIGDPPLYLGYLKGVPFLWTLQHLWQDWVFTVGLLLIVFFLVDRRMQRAAPTVPASDARPRVAIRGGVGLLCLALMLVGVFIPPILRVAAGMDGLVIGATFQVAVATASYLLAPREVLKGNNFSFEPVKEVGLLFAGIFLTMMPALGCLAARGTLLGITSPWQYYFGTGSLSAVLDNAPTYLSFLQLAFGSAEVDAAGLDRFLSTREGTITLNAISTGAVFFGAMTYIGNGPNFMVKAIAEASGVRMPGFFGYLARACLILLPILVLHALIFVR